jgi:ABC-type nitrate/sulfonate/bicarbonate transport system ATPase subunit
LLVNPNADVIKELNEIGLSGKENDYPKSLSGGMKRRVAILRALIFPYNTLLLDEPLNSLDLALKLSLIEKIKKFKTGGSDANESPVAGGVKASFQGGIDPPPYPI